MPALQKFRRLGDRFLLDTTDVESRWSRFWTTLEAPGMSFRRSVRGGGFPAPKASGVGKAPLFLKTKTGAREPRAPG
jgi:hypothetical protein